MNKGLYFVLFLVSVMISSISQILLKKNASEVFDKRLKEYLNPKALFAYFLFFSSTLLTVFAYRGVNLSTGPLIESTGYIYIMILSWRFLNERITKRKAIGNIMIIAGIVLFTFL